MGLSLVSVSVSGVLHENRTTDTRTIWIIALIAGFILILFFADILFLPDFLLQYFRIAAKFLCLFP